MIASFSRSASIRDCAPSRRSAIVLNAVSSSRSSWGPLGSTRSDRSPAASFCVALTSSSSGRRIEPISAAISASAPSRASTPADRRGDQRRAGVLARLAAGVGAPPALTGDQVLAGLPRDEDGLGQPALRGGRAAGGRDPVRERAGPALRGHARAHEAAAARDRCRPARATGPPRRRTRGPPGGARRARRRRARGTTSPRSRRPRAAATRTTRARRCGPARPRSPGAPRRCSRCPRAATSASTRVRPISDRVSVGRQRQPPQHLGEGPPAAPRMALACLPWACGDGQGVDAAGRARDGGFAPGADRAARERGRGGVRRRARGPRRARTGGRRARRCPTSAPRRPPRAPAPSRWPTPTSWARTPLRLRAAADAPGAAAHRAARLGPRGRRQRWAAPARAPTRWT